METILSEKDRSRGGKILRPNLRLEILEHWGLIQYKDDKQSSRNHLRLYTNPLNLEIEPRNYTHSVINRT